MGAYVEFNGLKCVKPDSVILSLLAGRAGNPKPNSFRSSWGEEPGVGWILLPWSDVSTLDLTLNAYQLKFSDDTSSVTIKDLTIVHYESVHQTPYEDANDVMLVKVCDARVYSNFTTIDKKYNYVRRSWLSDTDKRLSTSADELADGSEIVKDILGELPSSLFPTPVTEDFGANYTEIEYPENLIYEHADGWKSACDAAHRVALDLTFNKDGEIVLFSPYEQSGATALALIEAQQTKRIGTTRSSTPSPQRYPEKYRVLFRKAFSDVVGNTDSEVFANDEAHELNGEYASDITTNDIITVDVFPGTMMVLHHDTIIVDREFTQATYDTMAEELVTSFIFQQQNQNRNSITAFSGFIDFPFQSFQSVEYMETGNGPITMVRTGLSNYHVPHEQHPFPYRVSLGFGQVTTASTKYNRSSKAVSTDGRMKPIQRDGDDTLDDSSTKSLKFISYSDYPIKTGQNMLWITDTNSMRAVAIPIGLQTNKPLFIEFEIDTGLTSPLNATITQQFWGPTQSGSDLNVEVTCSNDSSAVPQYDLTTNGAIGLAFLREDGKYHCFDRECD